MLNGGCILGWNCYTGIILQVWITFLHSRWIFTFPLSKLKKSAVFCSSAVFFVFKLTCFLYVWLVVRTLIFIQDVYTELFLLCFPSCYLINTLHGENMLYVPEAYQSKINTLCRAKSLVFALNYSSQSQNLAFPVILEEFLVW